MFKYLQKLNKQYKQNEKKCDNQKLKKKTKIDFSVKIKFFSHDWL